MNLTGQIRTRFAPSPTGAIHIGNLRTALYAYLVAKKNKGTFLVRIEDTDQARFVEGSVEKILMALNWAGIHPDEGVMLDEKNKIIEKGDFGPYFQSRRLAVYKEHIDKLIEKGVAYPCFCSRERLGDLRKKQQKQKLPPKYDKNCLSLSKEEAQKKISAGEKYVIRLNVPEEKIIIFHDEVYGKISVRGETIDDQVLIKSDGYPTYHFAVVVDDHLMKITDIIRGEDWLPSTPKHVLLYEYFGWQLPSFVHVPNILGENKKKLSKRGGDVSVKNFIENGYLPETIVNFIALLGWNPKSKQEYFSLKELERAFQISGLHKAGAVFDHKKLDWMNAKYIKEIDMEKLFEITKPLLKKFCEKKGYLFDEEQIKKIVFVEKNRIKKIIEITENIGFYFALEDFDANLLRWKDNSVQNTKIALEKAQKTIAEITEDNFAIENLEKTLFKVAGERKGDLLWPLRVSLSGLEKSPGPFEIAWTIGKKTTLERIENSIKKLG